MDDFTDLGHMDALPPEIAEWYWNLSNDRYDLLVDRITRSIMKEVDVWDEDTDPIITDTVFIETVQLMYLQDLLSESVEDGVIGIEDVDEDGQLVYSGRR